MKFKRTGRLKMSREVRVISDIHGAGIHLQAVIREAYEQDKRLIFLGDVMDRGMHNLGAMYAVTDAVENHGATFVVGNHDDRFVRYMNGNNVKITHGLAETVAEIEGNEGGRETAEAFCAMVKEKGKLWHRRGSVVFAHAAVNAKMLIEDAMWSDKSFRKCFAGSAALYGENSGYVDEDEDGLIVRTYNWVDKLPAGTTAVVGHDIRTTTEPYFQHVGLKGGKALFLDNGSWERSKVNFLDMVIEEEQVLDMPSTGSLTIMVGPCGSSKSKCVKDHITLWDKPFLVVVSSDAIREELCGDFRDQSKNDEVFSLFYQRALQGLWEGKHVVLDATHLRRRDRLTSAKLGLGKVPVSYIVVDRPDEERIRDGGWRNEVPGLIKKHRHIFDSQKPSIMDGDDLNINVFEYQDGLSRLVKRAVMEGDSEQWTI